MAFSRIHPNPADGTFSPTGAAAERLAKEFSEETLRLPPELPPVTQMTMAEVEFEIGTLIRKKLKTQEDEVMLVLLMAASA